MYKQWSVGILIFDDVEVLDFTGPFEVYSVSAYPQDPEAEEFKPFDVKTVSETGNMVCARGGLRVQPDFSFENAPYFDILVIPGGPGARNQEFHNERLMQWLSKRMQDVQLMTSVCTGSLLLAKAGLLNGKKATTHWFRYDWLESEFPEVSVQRNVRYVDEGNIITSGGVSAGIDMSLYVVERLLGQDVARLTAKIMQYENSL